MGGAGTSVPPVLLEPPLELPEEELLEELLLDEEEELPLDPVLLPVLPKLEEPPEDEELPLDEELLLLDPLEPELE
jgi:hypothetical protein